MQLIATESGAEEISANLKEHNAIKYKKQSVLTIIRLWGIPHNRSIKLI